MSGLKSCFVSKSIGEDYIRMHLVAQTSDPCGKNWSWLECGVTCENEESRYLLFYGQTATTNGQCSSCSHRRHPCNNDNPHCYFDGPEVPCGAYPAGGVRDCIAIAGRSSRWRTARGYAGRFRD